MLTPTPPCSQAEKSHEFGHDFIIYTFLAKNSSCGKGPHKFLCQLQKRIRKLDFSALWESETDQSPKNDDRD